MLNLSLTLVSYKVDYYELTRSQIEFYRFISGQNIFILMLLILLKQYHEKERTKLKNKELKKGPKTQFRRLSLYSLSLIKRCLYLVVETRCTGLLVLLVEVLLLKSH